jgi:hypothetical protein
MRENALHNFNTTDQTDPKLIVLSSNKISDKLYKDEAMDIKESSKEKESTKYFDRIISMQQKTVIDMDAGCTC